MTKKEYTVSEKMNYWTAQIHLDASKAVQSTNPYELLHFVRQAYIKAKRLERLMAKGGMFIPMNEE